MNRRDFIKATAVVSSTSCTDRNIESACKDDKPNIIVLVSDDQRFDMLGCAGHQFLQTPNIDQLALKGSRFKNMFVTTPICAASRASILTGLYERTHGYTFKKGLFNDVFSSHSYPNILRKNGYFTGFVGKLGVRVSDGFNSKNFDYFRGINRTPYFHEMPNGEIIHETDAAAEYAKEFISLSAKQGRPFNLSVSFNAPHAARSERVDRPFPPPPAVDGMYKHIEIPEPKLSSDQYFSSLPDFLKTSLNKKRHSWRWETPGEYQKNMQDYLSMISGIDNAVGKIVSHLQTFDEMRNTVIIYTSDNGFYLGDRGFAGKWSHFDESTRVPLIIYDACREQAGQVFDSPVLNIDLYATLLDYAGVQSKSQGLSLKPLIQESKVNGWRKDFLLEHLLESDDVPKWEGVRSSEYLYARYFEESHNSELLYNLKDDPEQIQNIANDKNYKHDLEKMQKRCDELVAGAKNWSR